MSGIEVLIGLFGPILFKKILKHHGQLLKKIERIIYDWASKLPHDIFVHPSTLFGFYKENESITGTAMEPVAIKLSNTEVPSQQEWLNAITEKWELNRKHCLDNIHPNEIQPFYKITFAEVEPFLVDLSNQLFNICSQDIKSFQKTVVKDLDEIKRRLETHPTPKNSSFINKEYDDPLPNETTLEISQFQLDYLPKLGLTNVERVNLKSFWEDIVDWKTMVGGDIKLPEKVGKIYPYEDLKYFDPIAGFLKIDNSLTFGLCINIVRRNYSSLVFDNIFRTDYFFHYVWRIQTEVRMDHGSIPVMKFAPLTVYIFSSGFRNHLYSPYHNLPYETTKKHFKGGTLYFYYIPMSRWNELARNPKTRDLYYKRPILFCHIGNSMQIFECCTVVIVDFIKEINWTK